MVAGDIYYISTSGAFPIDIILIIMFIFFLVMAENLKDFVYYLMAGFTGLSYGIYLLSSFNFYPYGIFVIGFILVSCYIFYIGLGVIMENYSKGKVRK